MRGAEASDSKVEEENRMPIGYRRAVPDDYDAVFRLLGQLWPTLALDRDRVRDVYARGSDSDDDCLLVAEEGGDIVGFGAMTVKISFWQQSRVAYITTLVVDESRRGEGIGKAIVEAFAERAKTAGCRRIELDSGFHREEAHRMYERIGFGKRAYLFSKEIDAD